VAILVTGAAGFIGFHLTRSLLQRGEIVIGLDNMNDYYDVKLKKSRLELLKQFGNFRFFLTDLADRNGVHQLFREEQPEIVVHLAAQAGVRYSLENPRVYTDSNISGFLNILEECRHSCVEHLVFASSSSVYGANTKTPYSVHDNVDHPISLYAATKKANELMAHAYSHLYGIPVTGLRFFTVYGPWGRPDMAYFLFTKAILAGEPVRVFNYGKMIRDFTYIDDIIECLIRILPQPAKPNPVWSGENPDPGSSKASYRIYNIGNHRPLELPYLIEVLETALGRKAQQVFLPMQSGDVPVTYADVDDLAEDFGFQPVTPIEKGLQKFVEWYRQYYAK
jgi:UDP-glucuronate 4-epimerase